MVHVSALSHENGSMPSNWAELRNACDLSGAYTLTGGFDSTAYDEWIYIGGSSTTKINQTVAIIGNGAVVDASKKGSFFRVIPGASLTLQSITLQNGQNVSRGCQSHLALPPLTTRAVVSIDWQSRQLRSCP